MASLSVSQLADALLMPASTLLEYLRSAGLEKSGADDNLSLGDRGTLLDHLRNEQNAARIKLTRTQVQALVAARARFKVDTLGVANARKERARDPANPYEKLTLAIQQANQDADEVTRRVNGEQASTVLTEDAPEQRSESLTSARSEHTNPREPTCEESAAGGTAFRRPAPQELPPDKADHKETREIVLSGSGLEALSGSAAEAPNSADGDNRPIPPNPSLESQHDCLENPSLQADVPIPEDVEMKTPSGMSNHPFVRLREHYSSKAKMSRGVQLRRTFGWVQVGSLSICILGTTLASTNSLSARPVFTLGLILAIVFFTLQYRRALFKSHAGTAFLFLGTVILAITTAAELRFIEEITSSSFWRIGMFLLGLWILCCSMHNMWINSISHLASKGQGFELARWGLVILSMTFAAIALVAKLVQQFENSFPSLAAHANTLLGWYGTYYAFGAGTDTDTRTDTVRR